MHGDQSSASGNIHCCGEFEEILAILTVTADENRHGEWKAVPCASFRIRLVAIQTVTPLNRFWPVFPHLWGQTTARNQRY